MMSYIIILKVRKFHQTTASRFSTARKKPVGGHIVSIGLKGVHFGLLYMKIFCHPSEIWTFKVS